MNLQTACELVRNAKTLDALVDTIGTIERALTLDDWRNFDLTDLPTFGGPEPTNTYGIWSWDTDRLLVFAGNGRRFELIRRADSVGSSHD